MNNSVAVITADQLKEIVKGAIAEAVSCLTPNTTPPSAPATRPVEADGLMTRKEVCELLHVTKPTVWKWGNTGKLEPIYIDGMVRYRRADVNKLMKK